MPYHLDTIPVWDAIKQETSCPLCFLREKLEKQDVERFLGGSVMEPDIRIKVNEKGFCPRHHQMLYDEKNRLGHALLMQSRLASVREELLPLIDKARREMKGGFLKGDKTGEMKACAKKIKERTEGCVVCASIKEHEERYARTLLHLYKTDPAFQNAFEKSKGVCLAHLPNLISLADETLKGDALKRFFDTLYLILCRELNELQSDLDGFCTKFDYRNKDKPWGTSRGSLERAVNRLRGKTLKEET